MLVLLIYYYPNAILILGKEKDGLRYVCFLLGVMDEV